MTGFFSAPAAEISKVAIENRAFPSGLDSEIEPRRISQAVRERPP